MKRNSYEATGYKYGLLVLRKDQDCLIRNRIKNILAPDQKNKSNQYKEVNDQLYHGAIVPFESIDGLTISELEDYKRLLYEEKYLIFVMYDSMVARDRGLEIDSFINECETIIRYIFVIDVEENKDKFIDEIVEYHLINTVNKLSIQNRKRALGFLEKYVYPDKRSINICIDNYLDRLHEKDKSIRPYVLEYIKMPKRLIDE